MPTIFPMGIARYAFPGCDFANLNADIAKHA